MNKNAILEFRIATQGWEFEQIHHLNYRTFVEEIHQHEKNASGALVDKFNSHNTYVVCVRNRTVLAMIAIADTRPFSLEAKIDDLYSYLPVFNSICEIRLLSVKKEYRNTLIFTGLAKKSMQICLERKYDLAIISGTIRQLKLYKHLGFVAFGPRVGTKDAEYQPMYIDIGGAQKLIDNSQVFRNFNSPNQPVQQQIKSYMPGPVDIDEEVLSIYSKVPVSHRSDMFVSDVNELKKTLCKRLSAQNVQLFTGSGTLANDMVAAYLKALDGKGLIIVNGEFSERLVSHARSAGLEFAVISAKCGDVVDHDVVATHLQNNVDIQWLWTVICETSTGVLNDIQKLSELAQDNDVKLCLDGISAIGSVPVNLTDVYLATAVSGKGIGALAGIAMVFYEDNIQYPAGVLPRYFDFRAYEAAQGIPFTLPGNAIYALKKAIDINRWEDDYFQCEHWRKQMVQAIGDTGIDVVAKVNPASHILTLQLPVTYSTLCIGDLLEASGYRLSYKSDYLINRNWMQICFMGKAENPGNNFIACFKKILSQSSSHAGSAVH